MNKRALFLRLLRRINPGFTDGGFDADKLRADIEAVVSELSGG